MSNQYLYRCKECDFSLYTDDSGCECTFSGISYLYLCQDCKSLFKLWQSIHELLNEHNQEAHSKIWFSSENNFSKVEVSDICPKCHSSHALTQWTPANGCPKCGGMMRLDTDAPMIHTD